MAIVVRNLSVPALDVFATWCGREVARGVYMTTKAARLLSADDVAEKAFHRLVYIPSPSRSGMPSEVGTGRFQTTMAMTLPVNAYIIMVQVPTSL